MTMMNNLRRGAIAPALMLGLSLQGCGNHSEPIRPPVHMYTGLDLSGSVMRCSGAFTLLTEDLARGLTPKRDVLSLYRIDCQTVPFYDQTFDGNTDSLESTLVGEVQKVQAMNTHKPRRGTLPAAFWRNVAQSAHTEKGLVAIVLFSDGENSNETAASKETIRKAAALLASNPHIVSVTIIGAESDQFEYLKQCFGILGKRFHVYGTQQLDVQPVLDSLQQADGGPSQIT